METLDLHKWNRKKTFEGLKVDEDKHLSYREQYQEMKRVFWKVSLEFSNIASTLERIINLYCWEDATRTWIYLIALLLFCSVISIITFRFIILYCILLKFYKGRTRYRKVYRRNYILVSWTLDYIIKKHFPKDY